jgi:dimethylargininase
MITFLTRDVSPRIAECQLTFMERQAIDYRKACEQHKRYTETVKDMGFDVVSLPSQPFFPDGVFVEDNAVIVDEVAVIGTPARMSRRDEVHGLAEVLSRYRHVEYLTAGATLEGGDVIFSGNICYVGQSTRTNHEGIQQLEAILAPFGYEVMPVLVSGCLHLSTGASYLGKDVVLVNSQWVDTSAFRGHETIEVPRSEPWAANVLAFDDIVVLPESHPQTRALLESRGFTTRTIDISELMKAEAGLTCMSLIFEADPQKLRACMDYETLENLSS